MKSTKKNGKLKGDDAARYYCTTCKAYITTEAYVAEHLDHDVVALAEKCTRYLVEYQRLSRLATMIADRRQVHIKDESIEGIVQDIQAKLASAKASLHEDINRTIDATTDNLLKSPLIEDLARTKAELAGKDDALLSQIKDELSALCKHLLVNISENKFEEADKLINIDKLSEYEKTVKELSDKATSDVSFIQEIRKLKETKIGYVYDPLAILGMIHVETQIRKPPRIVQFNREKNEVNIYNIETKKTSKTSLVTEFVLPFRFLVIEADNKIYLNGGDNDHGVYLKSHYLYDELRGVLLSLESMSEPRSRHALAYVEGRIYSIGGENEKEVIDHCEYYQVADNEWVTVSKLNEARCGLSTCVMKKVIYTIGGWNQDYLSTIEKLDVSDSENKWELVKLAKKFALEPVQSAAAIRIKDDEMLIFGGYQAEEQLTKECYLFNTKKLTLMRKEELKESESFVSSEVINKGDFIYAFGYVMGGIHSYDIKNDEWSYIPQSEIT